MINFINYNNLIFICFDVFIIGWFFVGGLKIYEILFKLILSELIKFEKNTYFLGGLHFQKNF